jgi:hypothetical protein
MKTKHTVPLIAAGSTLAAAAPVLLIGGAAIVALTWLFSEDKKASIPSPEEWAKADALKIVPPDQQPPFTDNRPNVTPAHLTAIFNNGSRKLSRPAAVAALKSFGFGKTAAYKALSIDGRFASLLQFGPDGTIAWKG